MPARNSIDQWQDAVASRDAAWDGRFVYAVTSTGIFCRPSCPSRRPRADRIRFFVHPGQAEAAGYRACLRCHPKQFDPRIAKIVEICRNIESGKRTLDALSQTAGWSPTHLQRTFKSILGISPRQYAALIERREFERLLQDGLSVTDAVYAAGYNSPREAYSGANQNGMTPATYGKRGRGANVRYTICNSPLGRMLIAATAKGVCSIEFADCDESLLESLHVNFAEAEINADRDALTPITNQVLAHLETKQPDLRLPLDIRATVFQRLVWEELTKIHVGETQSYLEVAKSINKPASARAVARACACNPVAVAIPCHRVIHSNGDSSGYRWGDKRKSQLQSIEKKIRDNLEE